MKTIPFVVCKLTSTHGIVIMRKFRQTERESEKVRMFLSGGRDNDRATESGREWEGDSSRRVLAKKKNEGRFVDDFDRDPTTNCCNLNAAQKAHCVSVSAPVCVRQPAKHTHSICACPLNPYRTRCVPVAFTPFFRCSLCTPHPTSTKPNTCTTRGRGKTGKIAFANCSTKRARGETCCTRKCHHYG